MPGTKNLQLIEARRTGSTAMRLAFAACVLLIVHVSLYPWDFTRVRKAGTGHLEVWQGIGGRRDAADVVANIGLYVPFGLLGALALRASSNRRRLGLLLGGMALSLTVETFQQWTPARDPSLRDVVMNTAGAALGLWAASWAMPRSSRLLRTPCRSAWQGDVAGVALLALWVTAQCFPFMPHVHWGPLREAILRAGTPQPWYAVLEPLFDILLISYLLRNCLRTPHWRGITAGAAALYSSQFALVGGNAAWNQMAAAWLAAAIAVGALWRLKNAARWLAALALLVLAVKELYPFAFSGPPAHFLWTPFAGFLEADRGGAIRVLAGKAFLYGGAVWILREAGAGAAYATTAIALLLAGGEAAQRYLPGRTPESTDVLIALAAGTIALASRKEH